MRPQALLIDYQVDAVGIALRNASCVVRRGCPGRVRRLGLPALVRLLGLIVLVVVLSLIVSVVVSGLLPAVSARVRRIPNAVAPVMASAFGRWCVVGIAPLPMGIAHMVLRVNARGSAKHHCPSQCNRWN